MRIKLGTWYDSVDYEGNDLPSAVAPFKKERGTPFYVCVNHLGGHVWVKGTEFRPITAPNAGRITTRATVHLSELV